jgi:ech hydrogenase subunit A
MYPYIVSLFIIPLVVSGLLLVLPKTFSRIIVVATSFLLSCISLYLYINIEDALHFSVSTNIDKIVIGADILLLLYFGWVAVRKRNLLVGLLTVLQLGTFLYILNSISTDHEMKFMVDKLSVFMFLLINVISGIIAIFSLKYIEEENCSTFLKKYFLSIIFWFIAVMNMIVSSDNLEYFFLFFELTTLASFLLIRFRKDEVSEKNALTALWMNQVGGLAILFAIIFIIQNNIGAATFSNLLSHVTASGILLPLALLSIAALIKGAQMPFNKWLLGAMVAPTPVSALLHSSTMVKIAPFIILRLSPALKDTTISSVIIGLTAFVFVAAAIGALAQDNFKKILAHSTIALLALMIMMAAVGTPVTIIASLLLIFFHGISKCMLFLNAGILERIFHLKETSEMDKLGETSPFTSLAITIGFMSLLLPPFGAFIGKWFSIESLGTMTFDHRILGALVIVAIAGGGAVLSLLYFKVMGILISRTGKQDRIKFDKTNPFYSVTILILLSFIILSIVCFPFLMNYYFVPVASQTSTLPIVIAINGLNMQIGNLTLPIMPLLIAFILLVITITGAKFLRFKNVDRAKEYMCGEKVEYSFSSFYFSTDKAMPYFSVVGIMFFVALILMAIL